jgi:hypothetical protein
VTVSIPGLYTIGVLLNCCWSAVRSCQRIFLPPPLYDGGPPPLRLGGGTSPLLSSGVWPVFTTVLLLYRTDDISSGREPHLLHSHRRSLLHGHLSATACTTYSAGGMDLGCGGDIVSVRLHPRYVAAERETLPSPRRSGYGYTSSPRFFRDRAGSYGQLAWFWLSDILFFASPMSTWTFFLHLFALGTVAPLGRLLNFLSFSA